jgi:hypothetical protein
MPDDIQEFQRKIEQIKRLISQPLDPITDERLALMLEELEREVSEREAKGG